ncbi:MAG: hypothetical protein ABS75_04640 [Pelagibacterium sp. SCN 63-23]|nr:MAG: hypothetical protein ABS75_04640 [Pelagibacterium sp. SCN 63-23]
MPKVSVITGYYNRGEHLERTILSVLNQTYRDLELIVFDDASPDDSANRLKEIASRLSDPRLKVVLHERNKGFVQGMIDAIAMSSGEYVAVQGSGDISLPTRIEKQAAVLDASPEIGLVGCWYTNVETETNARRLRQPNADAMDFEALMKNNAFSHGEVMYRRSAYDAVGGYRAAFRNSQDIDLWLRMVKVTKMSTIPENLYDRYIRFDGVTYDPLKFPIATRYSMITRKVARAAPDEAEEMIAKLKSEGPASIILKSDKDFQKRIRVAAARSLVWGNVEAFHQLVADQISSPVEQRLLLILGKIFSSPPAAPLRKVVRAYLGIT